jgi:hypothetical protein
MNGGDKYAIDNVEALLIRKPARGWPEDDRVPAIR